MSKPIGTPDSVNYISRELLIANIEQLKSSNQSLKEKLKLAVSALERAIDQGKVAEHMQDEEWYQVEAELEAILKQLESGG
jgi:hypothetical protein